MTTFDDILEFWFVETPIGPKKAKKLSARWFAPAPAFDAEVEKLITYVGERKRVTRDDVLRAAGHSADQNPFELQSALGRGDVPHALAIADAETRAEEARNAIIQAHSDDVPRSAPPPTKSSKLIVNIEQRINGEM